MRALYYPEVEPSLKWLRTFALFYDCVGSIVPDEWKSRLSPELSEFAAHFPEAYEAVPPKNAGVYLFHLSAELLDRALQAVEATPPARTEMVVRDGAIEFPGYVVMHRHKLPPDVMDLLVRRGLVLDEKWRPIIPASIENCFIVERRASNLILAYIADDLARRSGWSTATDHDIEFYFNGLGRLERPVAPTEAQAFLATAVISSQVPSNILSMPWKQYQTIRSAYADLRKPLEDLFFRLTRQGDLSRISDPEVFQSALDEICSEFNSEVTKFSKTKLWRKVERAVPVALVTLTGVAAIVVNAESHNKAWGVGLGLGSLALRVYPQVTALVQAHSPNDNKVYQTMADLKRDIIKPSRFTSLF
jgi:hypothetical protein